MTTYRSGFIAIAGQPNVGKSTLLNGFLKEKLAIISKKPETTRDNIRGILTEKDCQIVFIDMPGIHKPHDLLGRLMLTRAQSSLMEADIILFLTEKRIAFDQDDKRILNRLPKAEEGKKVILVVNKVDRVKDKTVLLPLIEEAMKLYPFEAIVPMSALKEKDVDKLLKALKPLLPEGPQLYPEDQYTDRTEEFLIQEMIREKILESTFEEVPHSVAVVIDEMKENPEQKRFDIFVTIYVERTSQKSIIIGKNGEMMKKIGQLARKDIESLLSRHVYLTLWVKVREKWKKDPAALRDLGYSD
ncbi:MAG: GTPase Era [Candidatus Omnitrophota bacterium]